ncbi:MULTISPECIES: hypothetical protein [unclassified Pseudomonas]|uniref:hypothetical protein n=1 Tax=unclassified Pseudomonas TaxID=196821 RepID=UPI00117B0761|nr:MULTISPECIES: hypothetical protein [unclassified Pseudomonas]
MKKKAPIGIGFSAVYLGFAISITVVGFGIFREVDAAPFQQTDQEAIEAHYNECRNRYGPQLTRADAAKLDGSCNPMPEKVPEKKPIQLDIQHLEYDNARPYQ